MNLAFNLRPTTLADFVGQEHLVSKGKIIHQMLESGNLFSMIFWGPPGSGKTTLAYIIANAFDADFRHISAVESGKALLTDIIKTAKENQKIKEELYFLLMKFTAGVKPNRMRFCRMSKADY